MEEIYVSTDVEVDGPIPGPYSMLSFGSAAYTADKKLVGTFTANLAPLAGATSHPENLEYLQSYPEAWAACQRDQQDPAVILPKYVQWLKDLPGKPIFVGYPASFDFMFIYWYLIRFAGESPFRHAGLDIKSYSMALLKSGYSDAAKKNMPLEWFDSAPHTHIALDDAIEQGTLFCNMLAINKK